MVNPTAANPATPGQGGAVAKPAPAVGEKKEPKEPKAKKEGTGIGRPRFARPEDNLVITVLKPHAKTGNAGKRFDMLKTGMTIKEYRDILTAPPFNRTPGEYYRELRWNTDPHRQLMHIGPKVIDVPQPAEKPAA